MTIVFLNNNFMPEEQATISPADRSFTYGDGVYEVIPFYNYKPLYALEHIQRLFKSCYALKINPTYSEQRWLTIIQELVNHNTHLGSTQFVYLVVSRGSDPSRNYQFTESHPSKATIFARTVAFSLPSATEINSASLVSHPDIRWDMCHVKANGLTANVMLRTYATDHNATETLLHRNGKITECSSSNIFIVYDSKVYTTPATCNILSGITRKSVINLCAKNNTPVIEQEVNWSNLVHADEIWITSCLREVQAVTKLDGKQINGGKSGPLWRKIYDLYQQEIQTKCLNHNTIPTI